MPGPGGDENAVWSIAQRLRKRKGEFHRARDFEHARMGHYPEKTAQNEIRYPKWNLGPYGFLKTLQVGCVIGNILSMSIHEDVDVQEDHRDSSMTLSRAAVSSRSTPG